MRHDSDSAEMVEEVFRMLYRPYPSQRDIIIDVYKPGGSQVLASSVRNTPRTTFRRRLADAELLFAETWGELVRK